MSGFKVFCAAVNIIAVWGSMLAKCAKENGDFLNTMHQNTEEVILDTLLLPVLYLVLGYTYLPSNGKKHVMDQKAHLTLLYKELPLQATSKCPFLEMIKLQWLWF